RHVLVLYQPLPHPRLLGLLPVTAAAHACAAHATYCIALCCRSHSRIDTSGIWDQPYGRKQGNGGTQACSSPDARSPQKPPLARRLFFSRPMRLPVARVAPVVMSAMMPVRPAIIGVGRTEHAAIAIGVGWRVIGRCVRIRHIRTAVITAVIGRCVAAVIAVARTPAIGRRGDAADDGAGEQAAGNARPPT